MAFRRGAVAASFAGGAWRLLATSAALMVFAVGGLAPQHVASDFVLKLADGGLLLGMLALGVAFLMHQAGLVTLGAASVYGGVGYLFAITMSEWDLSPLAAVAVSIGVVVIYSVLLGALDRPHDSARLHDAHARRGRNDQPRRDSGRTSGLHLRRRRPCGRLPRNASRPRSRRIRQPGPLLAHRLDLRMGDGTGRLAHPPVPSGSNSHGDPSERGADALLGIRHLSGPRLVAFLFVNIIAGVCGLLHVLNPGFVSPESLGLGVSTNALVAALIGGTATSTGPLLGGVIFAFAQDEFGARGFTQLLTGLAIVIFIVGFPRGVTGAMNDFVRWLFRGREQEAN